MTNTLLLTGAALVALALCYVLVQSYRRATAWDKRREAIREYIARVGDAHNAARGVRRSALGEAPGKSRRRWFVPPRS